MVTTRYQLRESAALKMMSYDWQQHAVILLPILLVYLVLACYGIDRQSLWLDEILSIRDAGSLGAAWNKGHGPLYFVLLHLWMYIGTSELMLRALSVFFGAVSVCLLYAIGTLLLSRRAAVLGSVLFATSPYLIWYSQEIRYITLMMATALLTTYIFIRLTPRSRLGWWLVYGGSLTLAWAAFVTNIFLPMIHGLYLLWSRSRRPMLRKWLVCQILVFALFLGWAGGKYLSAVLVKATVHGEQTLSIEPRILKSGTHKAFSPLMLPYTFFAFSTGFSQGPSVRDLHVSRSLATLMPYAPAILTFSILFGGVFLIGLTAIWRQSDVRKFLILWIAIPILGALGISLLTNMAYNVRYVSMVLPAYVLILAAGIVRFRWSVIQAMLLVAVLCSNGVSLANYYFNPQYAREDARSAVRYLESVVHSRDIILVVGSSIPLRYYAKGHLPLVELGRPPDKTDRRIAAYLRNLTPHYERLWLVEIRPWSTDPSGKVKARLGKVHQLVGHKQLAGVDIYQYQLS